MGASGAQGKVFIVGLAGPSGSGKSTVARRVASRFNGHTISLEIYSTSMDDLPLQQRAKLNYDEPEAIDLKLLESHIRSYAEGKSIDAPIYDFEPPAHPRPPTYPCQVATDRGRHSGVAFFATTPAFRPVHLLRRPRRGLLPSSQGEGHHRASALSGINPMAVPEYRAACGTEVFARK